LWWRNKKWDTVTVFAWEDWGNIERDLNPAHLNAITAVLRSLATKGER